jgi:hypothetical protein
MIVKCLLYCKKIRLPTVLKNTIGSGDRAAKIFDQHGFKKALEAEIIPQKYVIIQYLVFKKHWK